MARKPSGASARKAKTAAAHERFCTPPCRGTDLEEIWEFIAADSVDAADQIVEEIHRAIKALIPFPQQGYARPDLSSRPLRFQAVRSFLIVYAPEEELSR